MVARMPIPTIDAPAIIRPKTTLESFCDDRDGVLAYSLISIGINGMFGSLMKDWNEGFLGQIPILVFSTVYILLHGSPQTSALQAVGPWFGRGHKYTSLSPIPVRRHEIHQ